MAATKTATKQPEITIGKIKIVTFEFTGLTPLLMDKRPPIGQPGPTKDWTPMQLAESKLYRDEESGVLYAPANWFRNSLFGGATGRKLEGQGKMGAATVLKMAVFCVSPDDKGDLFNPDTRKMITTWKLNSRWGTNQDCKQIEVHQPEIESWACRIAFEIDVSLISPDLVEKLFNLAGRVDGVGAWRPKGPRGGSGPYGRYTARLVSVS